MKKILYITPHLSTGGLPQYLVKKIELLKDEFDIYLIEYQNLSGNQLVVQKNKIKKLVPSNKFFTLDKDKNKMISLINHVINPDIIHFEEIPEYFVDYDIAKKIYCSDRQYNIVESTHTSTFDINSKLFFPDKFMMVSNYQIQQYKDIDVPKALIEYPIELTPRPDRTEALRKLGLNPDKKHILNVGLFTKGKNQKEFFEYARALPEYCFHSVGNQAVNFKSYWGPLMEDKPDNVTVWGERSNVKDYMQAMDLHLFTSTYEAMPLVIREALSYNQPQLIYNLPVYENYFSSKKIFDSVNYLTDNFEDNLDLIRKHIL
jgi:glycosyltransferase involved in cell wall biosynthesis